MRQLAKVALRIRRVHRAWRPTTFACNILLPAALKSFMCAQLSVTVCVFFPVSVCQIAIKMHMR